MCRQGDRVVTRENGGSLRFFFVVKMVDATEIVVMRINAQRIDLECNASFCDSKFR